MTDTNPQTTAFYRTKAQVLAAMLDFAGAAKALRRAIELYPDARGELAQRDIRRMAAKADAYERMASMSKE